MPFQVRTNSSSEPLEDDYSMRKFQLAAIFCLTLCACAGTSRSTFPSGIDQQDLSPALRSARDSHDSAKFLYYIQEQSIGKILLSRDKVYKHRSYGIPDARGIAVDDRRNLYETAVDGKNGTVVELSKNLEVARSIEILGGDDVLAVAVDKHGVAYVSCLCSSGRTVAIEEFTRDASGFATPVRTITGSQTGLEYPGAVAVDGAGVLYVADTLLGEILVYPAKANGNVAPIQVIGGDQTGLTLPLNLTLGADGNMYVSNQLPGSDAGYDVLVFPWSSNGNIAPVRVLQSGVYGYSVALGAGGEMYAGLGFEGDTKNPTFAEFAAGASGNDQPVGYLNGQFKGAAAYGAVLDSPWYQP